MSQRKRVSHKEKETTMSRSAVAMAVLLILPGLVHGQEVAVGGEMTHEVTRGETLWALAGRYLGNPFRWPLIFEANRSEIRDPHWIFPGQIFLIPGLPGQPATVREVAVRVEGEMQAVSPGEVPEGAQVRVPGSGSWPCPGPWDRTIFFEGGGERGCPLPSPAPSERTAFYSGPAGQQPHRPGGEVAGEPGFRSVTAEPDAWFSTVPLGLVYAAEWLETPEGEPESVGTLSTFDRTQADRPLRDRVRRFEKLEIVPERGVRLQVGDLLQAFEVIRSEERLGRVVRPTGILTVTAIEDGVAVAMVSAEFDRVFLGGRVRRAPSYTPRPGVQAVPVESNLTGVILGFPDDRLLHGYGATVFLDAGEDQGIVVGDEFGVYAGASGHASNEEVARLRVILVHGGTSTARIVALTEPVLSPGIHVRLVGKMR
jgi:hypothetical protein